MAKANSTNGRLIPAVSCIRNSSDKQDASPDQQREEIAKLAERGGYHIIREYFDDSISGDATEKRKAFQRMIADAETLGDFKAIPCWDQDRFGRFSPHEASFWTFPLVKAGVTLVTVSKGPIDWTDFAGWLTYSVDQHGKHEFLKDLSRNVLRGKLKAAKAGIWMTKAPYGYVLDKSTKTIHIGDKQEVATVRRMFREYLAGKSLRGVAVALNEEGLKTRGGNLWNGKTVREKLTNAAYCGRYVWNVDTVGKYHTVRDGEITDKFTCGTADASDWIVIDDHHPAIIDVATFETVQRRLAGRKTKTTPHRNGGQYVFTGICRCGKCGGRMSGHSYNGVAQYRCSDHSYRGQCDPNNVRQDVLLDAVVGAVEDRFLRPEKVERLRDILRQKTKERTSTVNAADLRRKLAKLDTKLTKARRNMALADGDDLRHEYEAVVRELREERERLDATLQDAQKPRRRTAAEQEERINEAIGMLSRLREACQGRDVPQLREFIQQTFAKVEVWAERDTQRSRKPFELKRGTVYLRPELWIGEIENLLLSS